MYLAYIDDSDTKAKKRKRQVVAAVVLKDDAFKLTRVRMSAVAEILMGEENLEKFKEFHACELYGGHEAFKDLDQTKRFSAIIYLLGLLEKAEMTVIYGTVDLEELKKHIYGSADPVDVCFRQCIESIKEWSHEVDARELEHAGSMSADEVKPLLMDRFVKNLFILIADECDKAIKHTLQQSFRHLQQHDGATGCFHDDMYFGDSRFSVGIQLADLCAYFIARHLEGDAETEHFYKLIEPRIYPRKHVDMDNLSLLSELGDGNKESESGISDVREGNGDDSPSKPQLGEGSDGSGEKGA